MLLLLTPLFFVVICLSTLQTRIDWIIDIYIRTWSRIWCLYLFVYWTRIAAVEGGMDCFFLNDLILNIIFLLLVFILSWSWNFGESLSGVRCFTLMLPKLSSFRFCQETLWLLSNKHAIRVVSEMVVSFFFYRNDCFVCTRSWRKTSFFLIFAVWYVTLEDLILS